MNLYSDLRSDLRACFADVVNSSSFEKSLRLVISYGALKRSTFIEALQERLEPKLKQVHAQYYQYPAFWRLSSIISPGQTLTPTLSRHVLCC